MKRQVRIKIEVWTDEGNPEKVCGFPMFRYVVQQAEDHWVDQAVALVAVEKLPIWFRDRMLNRPLPKKKAS